MEIRAAYYQYSTILYSYIILHYLDFRISALISTNIFSVF